MTVTEQAEKLIGIGLHKGVTLSVDDREEKPFYCSKCGHDYEPCWHWAPPDEIAEQEDAQ